MRRPGVNIYVNREGAHGDPLAELEAARIIEPFSKPYYLGPAKSIYCYVLGDGTVPAREFLEESPKRVRAGYAYLFQRMCDGHIMRGYQWRPWTESGCKGLCEYKHIATQTRIMHVQEGNCHVLLFGFGGKKEDKAPKGVVERAQRMRDEYQARRDSVIGKRGKR